MGISGNYTLLFGSVRGSTSYFRVTSPTRTRSIVHISIYVPSMTGSAGAVMYSFSSANVCTKVSGICSLRGSRSWVGGSVLSLGRLATSMYYVTGTVNDFLERRQGRFHSRCIIRGYARSCISCMSGRSRGGLVATLSTLLPRTKFVTRRKSTACGSRPCY